MAHTRILVINGPNLGTLGRRQPEVYGTTTLQDIERTIVAEGTKLDMTVTCFQSDIEGEIVKKIGETWQAGTKVFDGMIINPGGYTHTSVAIHDAILAASIPTIEVHISPVYKREEFRHTSIISSACIGQIAGFGVHSYTLAITALAQYFAEQKKK